ncbi:hypothetical protein DM02DRAFT_663933 [Periconia macrospinosa]|uniref:Uncharacterized protein n=1 Tax=Periconia macrospinosa TaxID=97972 RepID=A0A2V1D0H9_9PLEO|nr:hypothetical protein DM02DRAFT_663933 [Periconia macrospinosa]
MNLAQTTQRVRFAGSLEPPQNTTQPPLKSNTFSEAKIEPRNSSFVMQDLKTIPSFCCHLNSFCFTAGSNNSCLGYLETNEQPKNFKFIFYDAGKLRRFKIAQEPANKMFRPVGSILAKLQILHHLEMARRLATEMLRYHPTAWLCPDWSVNDISCFGNVDHTSNEDINEALQTLHLSTRFSPQSSTHVLRKPHDENQLKYLYGIRNLTLAKLGVALLEIGCRKDITELDAGRAPHRAISARKILSGRPLLLVLLGRKYIKLTRQCFRLAGTRPLRVFEEFGFDNQQAVT